MGRRCVPEVPPLAVVKIARAYSTAVQGEGDFIHHTDAKAVALVRAKVVTVGAASSRSATAAERLSRRLDMLSGARESQTARQKRV